MSNSSNLRPKGIDVSVFKEEIDWGMVKRSGLADFGFIKASEGSGLVDPMFARNWAGAKNAGVLRGAYHFFRTRASPEAKRKLFVSVIKSAEVGDLPPALDMEIPDQWSHLSVRARNDLILNWIEGIRTDLGENVHPIIYMSSYFADDVLGNDPRLAAHPLWVAHYTRGTRPRVAKPWSFHTFWQYSDSGAVSGINGAVDLNRFNDGMDQLKALLIKPRS